MHIMFMYSYLNENDLEAIVRIDGIIDERVSHGYGVLTYIVKEPSIMIIWSNASRSWYIYRGGYRCEAGDSARLDANEVLVPFSRLRVERVINNLEFLPLYLASLEAGLRGEIDERSSGAIWAMNQLEKLHREGRT